MSGSQADNIRRAIGRKQKDRLDAAMPSILEGYCSKSDAPREEAESEAKDFLQIIEDSASYQFGYNHSIAYCLLGYLCAYYRYYHPVEFLTSFLNNAANEDDIRSGTAYALHLGIRVATPKWGVSKSDYYYDTERKLVTKGLSSVKYISEGIGEELYKIAKENEYTKFVDVLFALTKQSSIDTRELNILIKIDFFSDFGNQRELLRLTEIFFDLFKKGGAKQIKRDRVDGTPLEPIVAKYSIGTTKSGQMSKSYIILDITSILREVEDAVKALHMNDLGDVLKVENYIDALGYMGYVTMNQEDRAKLYIENVYPLRRRSDGKQFGYSVVTKSLGSGKESRFSVYNRVFDKEPIKEGDLVLCKGWHTENGKYFVMDKYEKIML